MISPRSIKDFKERELRDSSHAKTFSSKKLTRLLEARGINTLRPPRDAQKICLLLGMKYPSYLFLMGTGGGKTFTTLNLFRNYRDLKRVERALVCVPLTVNLYEWERETKKHAPDCKIAILATETDEDSTATEKRWAILEDVDVDIVVVTYQGLCALVSKTVVNKKRDNKREWKRSDAKTDKVAKLFDMLILDESTKLANREGLPFLIIRRMRRTIEFCYLLTGTPFAKNPGMLWAQFFLVDFGHALGETYGLFREVFYNKVYNDFGADWTFNKKMKPLLSRRLSHCSVSFERKECQDLPPAIGGMAGGELMLLPVPMSTTARSYFRAIEKDYQDSHGQLDLLDNAYARMRMVSSGWLGARDEEGERVELVFDENPKLDAVIGKLRELGDEKAVVVHYFNVSGEIVAERLKKEKISFVHIYRKTPSGKREKALEAFRDPNGPRVLLASTAIAYGVNLQDAARYMIFFESPDSPIDREQMEGRILREGEKSNARFFYDAVCKGTKDVPILLALQEGKSLREEIVHRKSSE